MENMMTPADVAAVTRGMDGDGMGSGNAWILIILFALIFGGGVGSWGNRSGGNPVTEADLCNANSFSDLKNQVGRLNDMQSQMYTGLQNGICNLGYETLRNFNSIATQLASCCCEIQRGIDTVNYNGAINTANIIQAQERGTQKILDAICGNRMADMQNQINQLQLQAALCGVIRYPTSTTYNAANPFFGGCCA